MANKRKALSRGLEALLGNIQGLETAPSNLSAQAAIDGELRHLPVELLQRGKYQPRRDMRKEALEELANSIRAQGILQPIIVRKLTSGHYEIIAGERRWRAAQLAGLNEVPVIVRHVPDETAIALALIENIQRENLNPIEEANALQRLLAEFSMTHQQVAEAVGKSRTTVTNLLRLIQLNETVKKYVAEGKLEMGHARALLGLSGNAQTKAAEQVVLKGLSVRETEQLVRNLQAPTATAQPAATLRKLDPNLQRLQTELAEKLGSVVVIEHNASGKGKLIISYNSVDEFEGILKHMV